MDTLDATFCLPAPALAIHTLLTGHIGPLVGHMGVVPVCVEARALFAEISLKNKRASSSGKSSYGIKMAIKAFR